MMNLEKNVVKAPIPYRSRDGQSHFDLDNNYYARAKRFYEKIGKYLSSKFQKNFSQKEDLFKDPNSL